MTVSLYVKQSEWIAGYADGSVLQALLDLITSEHNIRPNFMEVVQALLTPLVDGQALLGSLSVLHNIDFAEGEQLDHLGQWIGFSRRLPVPLQDVYFEWDGAVELGWELGSWQGPFDSLTGISVLPDDAYRIYLRAKIAANAWDSTLPGAYEILNLAFGTDNHIILQDNQDMSMTVAFIGGTLSSVVTALMVSGLLPLKPSGVRIQFYALPADTGKMFAWDSEGPTLGGWEEASWCREIYPPLPVLEDTFSWDALSALQAWEAGNWQTGL